MEGLPRVASLTLLSSAATEIDERFGTRAWRGELVTFCLPTQRFSVQSYLDQGFKLTSVFGWQLRRPYRGTSSNCHDIGLSRGGLNKALSSCTVPTMVAGVDTDILYPYQQRTPSQCNRGILLAIANLPP